MVKAVVETTVEESTSDPVAAAEQAIAEAEEHLAAVRLRVRCGELVTPAELAEAQAGVELAQTRRVFVVEAEAERAEADRLARIAAIRAELPSRLSTERADKALVKAKAALEAFCAEAAALDRARADVVAELEDLAPLPSGLRLQTSGTITVTDGPATYRPMAVQWKIYEVARDAILANFPRSQIKLG
jgi:hypothetical protein